MIVAGLQTRVDLKYLVPVEAFLVLGDRLAGHMHALDIGGLRTFGYESVYFDTRELDLYRAHLQGRRLRYKVRTRTYLNSGETMFEAKLKGGRGQTIKLRLPHPRGDRFDVTAPARAFLEDLLQAEYGVSVPDLSPAMTTTYSRTTLADMSGGARLTCDVDLVYSCSTRRTAPGEHVLIESKSPTGRGLADAVLRELGIRPVQVSKYCAGLALLHPHLPANPWNRTLRRYFGYQGSAQGSSRPTARPEPIALLPGGLRRPAPPPARQPEGPSSRRPMGAPARPG